MTAQGLPQAIASAIVFGNPSVIDDDAEKIDAVIDARHVGAPAKQEHPIFNPGAANPTHQRRVFGVDMVTAHEESRIGMAFRDDRGGIDEGAVIFDRIETRGNSDKRSLVRDAKLGAELASLRVVRRERVDIVAIRDDHDPGIVVPQPGVNRPRRNGATDDFGRQYPRGPTAGVRHELRHLSHADIFDGAITDVPNNRRTSRELARDSAEQIGVIHPALDDVRLLSTQNCLQASQPARIDRASFHAERVHRNAERFHLRSQHPAVAETDDNQFEPRTIHLRQQSGQRGLGAASIESGYDVNDLQRDLLQLRHMPAAHVRAMVGDEACG